MSRARGEVRRARLAGVHRGALAAAALLALLGAWAAVEAWGYGLWRGRAPGEGLFPFGIALAVLALSLAFGLEAVLDPRDPPTQDDENDAPAYGKVAAYLAGLLAFGLLLESLGALLVTAAVLFVILRFAEGLSWTLTVGVVAATIAVTHLVFERLLALPLPRGELF